MGYLLKMLQEAKHDEQAKEIVKTVVGLIRRVREETVKETKKQVLTELAKCDCSVSLGQIYHKQDCNVLAPQKTSEIKEPEFPISVVCQKGGHNVCGGVCSCPCHSVEDVVEIELEELGSALKGMHNFEAKEILTEKHDELVRAVRALRKGK